jgi:RimJ/RimL family protein N-acetyltransferase
LHVTFRIVDNEEISAAFAWHRDFAEKHEAIYPRDRNTFTDLVLDRLVWCAVTEDDVFRALSYAAFERPENKWEIGGLMVSEEMRGKGLGSIMMRLPLAHMLINELPLEWDEVPAIVAHVLAGNNAPRGIIPKIGFEHHGPVEIPSEYLPGLKADEDGMVRGDEFWLPVPEGIKALAQWCANWDRTLRDGTSANVDLLDGLTMKGVGDALRSMI